MLYNLKKNFMSYKKNYMLRKMFINNRKSYTPGHYTYQIWVLDKKNYMSLNDF